MMLSAISQTQRNKIEVSGLTARYGQKQALRGLTFDVREHEILAIIGPAQSGKTTLLRALNRTLHEQAGTSVAGSVRIDGVLLDKKTDVHALRRRIGMVAPLPVGLPMTIYENVAFAPRMAGLRNRAELDVIVERHSLVLLELDRLLE
jgi:phosphate transport system ATP-binding protein